jgi:hypothetical protein
MKVLQVKQYNKTIAREKEALAMERWRERGYGFPVSSMFYYYLPIEFAKGLNVERKNGYVAFDERGSAFGMTPEKAIAQLSR